MDNMLNSIKNIQNEHIKNINKKIELLFIKKAKEYIPNFTKKDFEIYQDKFLIKRNPMSDYTEYIYKPTENMEILLFSIIRYIDSDYKIHWEIKENKNN